MRGLSQFAQRVRRIEKRTSPAGREARWLDMISGAKDRLLADLRSHLPADTPIRSFEEVTSSWTPEDWQHYRGFRSWLTESAARTKAQFLRRGK